MDCKQFLIKKFNQVPTVTIYREFYAEIIIKLKKVINF